MQITQREVDFLMLASHHYWDWRKIKLCYICEMGIIGDDDANFYIIMKNDEHFILHKDKVKVENEGIMSKIDGNFGSYCEESYMLLQALENAIQLEKIVFPAKQKFKNYEFSIYEDNRIEVWINYEEKEISFLVDSLEHLFWEKECVELAQYIKDNAL